MSGLLVAVIHCYHNGIFLNLMTFWQYKAFQVRLVHSLSKIPDSSTSPPTFAYFIGKWHAWLVSSSSLYFQRSGCIAQVIRKLWPFPCKSLIFTAASSSSSFFNTLLWLVCLLIYKCTLVNSHCSKYTADINLWDFIMRSNLVLCDAFHYHY